MATLELIKDEILTDSNMDSSGSSSITRKLFFVGSKDAKITDVITSPLYPQIHSLLPSDVRFSMDSINCNGVGDIPPTFEATAQYKFNYIATSRDRNGNPITANTKPWLLPIQDLSSTYNEIEVPFISGWRYEPAIGMVVEKEQLRNKAGFPLVATTTANVRTIAFTFNMRHTGRTPTFNTEPVINSEDIRVAGVLIKAYTGKLMPITSQLITVMNQNGRGVRWEYWSCRVEIKIHPDKQYGWIRRFLNVGTICRWFDNTIGPAYKYYPWGSKTDLGNYSIAPVVGNIHDVVKAKNKYAALFGNQGTPDYNAAWTRLPWEEMTEPLPMDNSGRLDTSALNGVTPYKELFFLDYDPVPWRGFNFPEYR